MLQYTGFGVKKDIRASWILWIGFLFLKILLILCVYLPDVCLCTTVGLYRGKKRVSESLELELQEVVSCCVVVGD